MKNLSGDKIDLALLKAYTIAEDGLSTLLIMKPKRPALLIKGPTSLKLEKRP